MRIKVLFILFVFVFACKTKESETVSITKVPFTWENATVYFLLTDRFNDGDSSNNLDTITNKAAPYRGFMGGDLKGVIQKIEDGYFDSLGVTAIWTTPIVQNILGSVDEGTGISYGFHGYWTRDWTEVDERIGTREDFKNMVKAAHKHGIRVLMDIVLNHTGPVTPVDPLWPSDWVKTEPQCVYKNVESTINCTLVKNLPDIRTEDNKEVGLPTVLVEKWKKEGRYDQEVKELEEYFARTGNPRYNYYYIIKWLIDYIKEYGIDGFRIDTAKHVEGYVWKALIKEAKEAFLDWKKLHPEEVLDDNEFYTVGEVYNYFIGNGLMYDYGDKKYNFFADGYKSLINFDFKYDATRSTYDSLFIKYDTLLHNNLKGYTVLNYISSHDDGQPYDVKREKTFESATKLLLCQGGAQIYYGDEVARTLQVPAAGDATLRSFMDWTSVSTQSDLLTHWRKLGMFRAQHPSIGAGRHTTISQMPYTFSRTWSNGSFTDQTLVVLDAPKGKKKVVVGEVFKDGDLLIDHYSGKSVKVSNGQITIDSQFDIVLLSK